MTVTDWIQAISTLVLVAVTAIYAWRTHIISTATDKQANASVKMAEEMREQRFESVRPVIDIQRHADADLGIQGRQDIEEGVAAGDQDYSRGLSCDLHNIGLGPAIDVASFVIFTFSDNPSRIRFEFGTLAVGQKYVGMRLSLEQHKDDKVLVVCYRDVHGRTFESSRKVGLSKAGWELGPLQVNLVETRC